MDIKEIGQELINELQEELNKSVESATMVKGAIKGVHMFFERMQQVQQEELASVSAHQDLKTPLKRKKSKK